MYKSNRILLGEGIRKLLYWRCGDGPLNENYNLYPLHVLRVVARVGSVTRAANELFISQPAVSAHLRTLEGRYGDPLFERSPRGLLLTPLGETVLGYAHRLLALAEEMATAVEEAKGVVRGRVVVAASSTPGAYLLPERLRCFQERYPDTETVLRVGDSAQVCAWLQNYDAPLGVIGEALPSEGFCRERIGADEIRLVVRSGHPLGDAEQVGAEHVRPLVLYLREHGSSTREGAERMLGDLLGAFGRVEEVASGEVIKQSVIAGLGVAVLSSWATRFEEGAGFLRPVKDLNMRRERNFYLARRADRPLIGAAGVLWKFLLDEPPTAPAT